MNYENEISLRRDLGVGSNFSHDNHIAPILCHFDATMLDKKTNEKFVSDRMDERFRKLPTYAHTIGATNHNPQQGFINISGYPYAIMDPLFTHANLLESMTSGIMDLDILSCVLKDM